MRSLHSAASGEPLVPDEPMFKVSRPARVRRARGAGSRSSPQEVEAVGARPGDTDAGALLLAMLGDAIAEEGIAEGDEADGSSEPSSPRARHRCAGRRRVERRRGVLNTTFGVVDDEEQTVLVRIMPLGPTPSRCVNSWSYKKASGVLQGPVDARVLPARLPKAADDDDV